MWYDIVSAISNLVMAASAVKNGRAYAVGLSVPAESSIYEVCV